MPNLFFSEPIIIRILSGKIELKNFFLRSVVNVSLVFPKKYKHIYTAQYW